MEGNQKESVKLLSHHSGTNCIIYSKVPNFVHSWKGHPVYVSALHLNNKCNFLTFFGPSGKGQFPGNLEFLAGVAISTEWPIPTRLLPQSFLMLGKE